MAVTRTLETLFDLATGSAVAPIPFDILVCLKTVRIAHGYLLLLQEDNAVMSELFRQFVCGS